MAQPILVTCYVNPDLDGVAGAVAYAEFLQQSGQTATAGIIGTPHDEAIYVLDRFAMPYPKALPDANSFQDVILVDASDLNGLEGRINPQQVVEIIDHRQLHEAGKFPHAKAQIELVGAAATLVTERFMQANTTISKPAAILLYAAIISNTLNFKASVTTDRDHAAAAWLNRTAQLPDTFWKELFTAKSDLSGTRLAERIAGDFAWFELGGKRVGIAQLEIIGAERLVRERTADILTALHAQQKALRLDMVFQTTIELAEAKNFFVADDPVTQRLLSGSLHVHFTDAIAERPGLIMRKQVVPLLKTALEAAR